LPLPGSTHSHGAPETSAGLLWLKHRQQTGCRNTGPAYQLLVTPWIMARLEFAGGSGASDPALIPFILDEEYQGVFLRRLVHLPFNHAHLAQNAANLARTMIPGFDADTMMTLPLTVPSNRGEFCFGKITVISWLHLLASDFNENVNVQKRAEVTEKLQALRSRVWYLPVLDTEIESSSLRFKLDLPFNDATWNGPILVAQDLEPLRSVINEIRASLGLDETTQKVHSPICRLTGRNRMGQRDDGLLRKLVEPAWPRLPVDGYPEVLQELPFRCGEAERML